MYPISMNKLKSNHGNLDKYVKLVGDTFLKNILDKKLGNNVSTENN